MPTNTSTANKKLYQSKNRQFTQDQKNKIVEKLVATRVKLLLRHPFFGNMATRMKLVDATEWCGTLATDGRNFYYNNDFVSELTASQCEFGFAHEILHNVFDHMGRRNGRDPQLSNIAADYAVNQILVDERIGTVPSIIQIYQDSKYRGKSYEEIYEELQRQFWFDERYVSKEMVAERCLTYMILGPTAIAAQ
jgi:predicted metal-dependent peptidase